MVTGFIKRHWMPITLIVLGLATRFAFIWWPNEVVFDEVHAGKLAASYFTGEFSFFDIHPPLGKLFVVLALWLGNFHPGFDFASIGESYGAMPYVAFRFFPNFFGALIPLAAWWLARELNFSKLAAFSAGLFLVLDSALIAHSHFVVFDAFMLFFGFTGLAAFLRARSQEYNLKWLVVAGLLIGSSISSKWVGLAFLSAALIIAALDYAARLWSPTGKACGTASSRSFGPAKRAGRSCGAAESAEAHGDAGWTRFNLLFSHSFLSKPMAFCEGGVKIGVQFFAPENYFSLLKIFAALVVMPAIVYVSVFAVHFALITKPGSGNAFLSPEFQSKNFYGKFIELNRAMYTVNAGISASHSYSSKPYTWPLSLRSVYYWAKSGGEYSARIYLIGNPAVWWGSTFFGALALIFWWPRENEAKKWLPAWLWLVSILPFVFVKRPLFLYHYLTALIAAVMLMAGWLGDEPQKRIKIFALYTTLAAALILFVYFAPLTYGFYLTEAAFKSRLWLPGWL